MQEDVLVVENTLLRPYLEHKNAGLFKGRSEEIYAEILGNYTFMPREKAEYDPDHKQVIPYVIVRENDNYLLLKRTKKQSEKRLHNKYSLGIGGHVNPETLDHEENVITGSLHRELNEEVLIGSPGTLDFIGIINDESNSVSRVHLGLLYVMNAGSSEYRVLEDDKMTAQWVSRDGLKEYYEGLETWSQIAYDHYIISVKA